MNKEIDIKILWSYIKENFKLFFMIITAFFLLGLIYVLSTDKTYIAETTIFIDPQQTNILKNVTSEETHSEQLSKASIESQISIISSRKVILKVVDNIIKNNLIIKDNMVDVTDDAKRNILVKHIKKNVTVTHDDDTYIINIQYQDKSPIVAAKIANFFADAYVSEQVETGTDVSTQARLWLSKKINRLKIQMSEANKSIQDFKVDNNFFASSKDLTDVSNPTSSINHQLSRARSETALAKASYEHSHNLIKTRNIDAALAEALDSDVINNIRSKYLDRKKKYFELQRTLGDDHQVVRKAKSEIQEYESLIFAEMRRFTRSQLSAYEIAKLQEKTLEARLTQLLKIEKDNSVAQTKLADLEQKAQAYQNILDDFIEKYENLEQKEGFTLTTTRIISEATPPTEPAHPKTMLILVISILFGSGFAFITILYLANKDTSLKTAEDINKIFGLKNMGYIPKGYREYKIKNKTYSLNEPFTLTATNQSSSPITNETFRRVKYKIDTISTSKVSCKSIGITSSKSNEGKTTIAIGLAQYLARLGHKTLLIDLDTYNPMFNKNNFSYEVPTLKGYFQSNLQYDMEEILKDYHSNLYIIPMTIEKDVTRKPFDIQEIENIFSYLGQCFEYIICDMPPLSITADTEMTIPHIDGFIIAVEWAKTNPEILKNHLINVGLPDNKIIGTIINKIDLKKTTCFSDIDSNYINTPE